jgi:hypothetical protein
MDLGVAGDADIQLIRRPMLSGVVRPAADCHRPFDQSGERAIRQGMIVPRLLPKPFEEQTAHCFRIVLSCRVDGEFAAAAHMNGAPDSPFSVAARVPDQALARAVKGDVVLVARSSPPWLVSLTRFPMAYMGYRTSDAISYVPAAKSRQPSKISSARSRCSRSWVAITLVRIREPPGGTAG